MPEYDLIFGISGANYCGVEIGVAERDVDSQKMKICFKRYLTIVHFEHKMELQVLQFH